MGRQYLVVTIDTEVDTSGDWSVSDPVSFSSVLEGVPQLLTPLFDRFGVRPTYLLSPEVIEDYRCIDVLGRLLDRSELGTHLHADFIEPGRRLHRDNMAGAKAGTVQTSLPRAVEEEKLGNLTDLFRQRFGAVPLSFRCGGYSLSESTLELLAKLGYRVDSSVTPGIRWRSPNGELDYRSWTPDPWVVEFGDRSIVELPISIWSARARGLADGIGRLPRSARRATSRALRPWVQDHWLRPSWHSGDQLVRFIEKSSNPFLVLMFHSQEIIVGASPYARTGSQASIILQSLERVFSYCDDRGIESCGLTEAAERFCREEGRA